MQPAQLTIPGVILFILTALVIFAFKNPIGFKKISGNLESTIIFLYGIVLGVNGYKFYLISKFNGKLISDSIITYFFSFGGDLIFYAALAYLLYCGINWLEEVHELNDKLKDKK